LTERSGGRNMVLVFMGLLILYFCTANTSNCQQTSGSRTYQGGDVMQQQQGYAATLSP